MAVRPGIHVALLLASVLLAGCGAGALQPVSYPPDPSPPPVRGWAPLQNVTLVATSFHLQVGQDEARFPIYIPARNVEVVVTLNLTSGASHSLHLRGPGGCALGPTGPFVATGQSLTTTCGALPEGEDEVIVTHASGDLMAYVEVVARVCPYPEPDWGAREGNRELVCPKAP